MSDEEIIEEMEKAEVYAIASARTVQAALNDHVNVIADAASRHVVVADDVEHPYWYGSHAIVGMFKYHVMANPGCPTCKEDLAWAKDRPMLV